MKTGQINVQTENIFPIIKKFLYSDHEIFLRELVSNAVDATQKLKALSSLGKFTQDLGNPTVEVILDKTAKTITIRDNGIGMTSDEIEKYINQIAFSGAEEFVKKYENISEANALIGHFGLGFYSSFMVSKNVEIITKSYLEDSVPVKWECDGSPNYSITETTKETRGTDIVLHIAEDSEEFLEEARLDTILSKYCKFLPVSIIFGTESKPKKDDAGEFIKDADGKMVYDESPKYINNTKPTWKQSPSELKDEDYKNFYRELYPMTYDEPLFQIHLNVDYPFNLTGVLFFPKVKNNIEVQKNKIQLYCNQVFVTDSVENIVPEFLTLLHGVIDSPDIPLNVSRSYLQSDSNVKKISSHISKKVADKLEDMFKKDREDFEKKWDDIKVFIEYGMISDEKFYERAEKWMLFKNSADKYFTIEEYKEHTKTLQTDKNSEVVYLYTTNKEEQHSFINTATERGYDVLVMDGVLDQHFINHVERKLEKVKFARVDADTIEKLIDKGEKTPSKLSDTQQDSLKHVFQSQVSNNYTVQFESLSETDNPITITEPEFMRRMKDMQKLGGGGGMMGGSFPDFFNLVVNSNHPIINKISTDVETKIGKDVNALSSEVKGLNDKLTELRKEKDANKTEIESIENEVREKEESKEKMLKSFGSDYKMVKQLTDLALLSRNMLKGEDLTKFIKRSYEILK
ncbi:MAG: molecular chaperone HtpG [Bacteroidota bacterium]